MSIHQTDQNQESESGLDTTIRSSKDSRSESNAQHSKHNATSKDAIGDRSAVGNEDDRDPIIGNKLPTDPIATDSVQNEHDKSGDGLFKEAQIMGGLEKAITSASDKPYSTFTIWQKRFIILSASVGSFISPLTTNIYFPALNTIASELHVSITAVNLSITTYMVCQCPLQDPMFCIIWLTMVCSDLPRLSPHIRRWFLRQRGSAPSIHSGFHCLHWRQHRTGPSEQLCRLDGAPLCAECR